MENNTLQIAENLNIDVIRKSIKNVHLSVHPPEGRIRLAAPLSVSDDTLRLFVVSKIGWIRRQQRSFQKQERQSEREYKEKESHYFQGHRYLLRITEKDKNPKVTLKSKTHLDLQIRPNSTQEQKDKVMSDWYRSELKKHIPSLIEKWETKMGVKCNDWRIKQMKTKWGTCTIEEKRIWLNLELAKKPLHCLEYVIVHELTHLLERHHNERFYAYMNHHLPQWKEIKKELNEFVF
ncbi:SprT family zinc-dependent metalloprotease [Bernardetia sp. ABR2-2B]|uniref:M48 family metallopeptidase n=1 Tax=Bernardetia sp. ABR2-2B TaxID=3127472 RepID=UPI0030CB09B8